LKLKWWLLILLCLNAAVLAWQWDAFARWGYGPDVHREPERLKQQIRPEAMRLEIGRPDATGLALPVPAAAASEAEAVDATAAPRPLTADAPAAPPAATVAPASAGAAPSSVARP
jgi:hypothetical protein